jgi:EAL domain-containing protein (putative c-di-GMP-specific phosphodiesterase class I)
VHEGVRVAIDVSSLPLADASLADRLTEMVHARGHKPRQFVWALDGVVLARAQSAAVAVLTRLRVKGFGLSMRYSGTGPSWTSHVGRVPLSDIKLDGRLVSGATADPRRLAALESAVRSAHETGLRVVADGCDSQTDFDTLLALGCSEAQGRFIGDPMEAAGLISWALTNGAGAAG